MAERKEGKFNKVWDAYMILARFRSKTSEATFLRNFIFGVEDGLVSTVGLLS